MTHFYIDAIKKNDTISDYLITYGDHCQFSYINYDLVHRSILL